MLLASIIRRFFLKRTLEQGDADGGTDEEAAQAAEDARYIIAANYQYWQIDTMRKSEKGRKSAEEYLNNLHLYSPVSVLTIAKAYPFRQRRTIRI